MLGLQGSSPGTSLKQQAHVLAIMALQLHIADPVVPIQRRICNEAITTLLGPYGLPGYPHALEALVFTLVKFVQGTQHLHLYMSLQESSHRCGCDHTNTSARHIVT